MKGILTPNNYISEPPTQQCPPLPPKPDIPHYTLRQLHRFAQKTFPYPRNLNKHAQWAKHCTLIKETLNHMLQSESVNPKPNPSVSESTPPPAGNPHHKTDQVMGGGNAPATTPLWMVNTYTSLTSHLRKMAAKLLPIQTHVTPPTHLIPPVDINTLLIQLKNTMFPQHYTYPPIAPPQQTTTTQTPQTTSPTTHSGPSQNLPPQLPPTPTHTIP